MWRTKLHGLRWEMRHQFNLVLIAIFMASCASAVPPARIGEYVSSWRQVGRDAFR